MFTGGSKLSSLKTLNVNKVSPLEETSVSLVYHCKLTLTSFPTSGSSPEDSGQPLHSESTAFMTAARVKVKKVTSISELQLSTGEA